MEEYIDGFINYMVIERNYSTHTETNYLIDLEDFNNYLKNNRIKFNNITYKDIVVYTKYLKEKKEYNSSSINRHLSCLRSFYNYLIRSGAVKTNPFKLVNGPKKEMKLPNYMKYNEFVTMVDSLDDSYLGLRNRALLELLLASGARISEIINLEVNDLDFNNNSFKVLGKGNKERICYFNSYASDALNKYINESRPNLLKGKSSKRLFINNNGTDLTDRGVRYIIDEIIKRSCLNTKVTPHTFRHTFATMLLNEGCDLKSVQELLGHVNLSTTSVYTHVTNDRIKEIYLHTHPRGKK